MLSMKMSMDDHPEDQERSEKEQALPLNVSDCMDNPSCKDQPQPATCSGQPTGETIGSIQSRSLSAGNARKLIQKQDDILYYVEKCHLLIKFLSNVKAALSDCRIFTYIMDLNTRRCNYKCYNEHCIGFLSLCNSNSG